MLGETPDELRKSLPDGFVDLARRLLILLHAADTWPNGGLYNGPCAKEAVRRYLDLWLPLCRKASARARADFVPPLDVAFVQLVHRLNPKAYETDVKMGMVPACCEVEPLAFQGTGKYLISEGGTARRCRSRKLWAQDYRQKKEPFFPPRPYSYLGYGTNNALPSRLDLVAALGRQRNFLHSLLRPCYLERPFLEYAALRYCSFMLLAKNLPRGAPLVPMMDIDLMWHTHMAAKPQHYLQFCQALGLPSLLDHDDGITEDVRQSGFESTKAAWEAAYGTEAGAVYNPPPTRAVPPHVRHPVEALVGPQLLELFQPPATRMQGSPKAVASTLQVHPAASRTTHSGGHACYLAWMLQREAAKLERNQSSWMCCVPGAGVPVEPGGSRRHVVGRVLKKGLKFSANIHLPHDDHHPYWRSEFQLRDLPNWAVLGPAGAPIGGQQQAPGAGVAVGVPVAQGFVVPKPAMRGPAMSYALADAHVHMPGVAPAAGQPASPNSAALGSRRPPCSGCGRSECTCRLSAYGPYDACLLPAFFLLYSHSHGYWDPEARAFEGAGSDAAGADPRSSMGGVDLPSIVCAPDYPTTVDGLVGGCPGWNSDGVCRVWQTDGGGGGCGGGGCGGGC